MRKLIDGIVFSCLVVALAFLALADVVSRKESEPYKVEDWYDVYE